VLANFRTARQILCAVDAHGFRRGRLFEAVEKPVDVLDGDFVCREMRSA
jgi:hypothetical protein